MIDDLNKYARDIIDNNEYLTLATLSQEKGVWVSILCYGYDQDYNFYFASVDTSQHCKDIAKNSKVAFTIFDSHQNWGLGVGLQIEGEAKRLTDNEAKFAGDTYFSRKFPYGTVSGPFLEGFQRLLNEGVYSFYKLTPSTVWMNNPNSESDERVIIDLKK